jgi:hypothetical protein
MILLEKVCMERVSSMEHYAVFLYLQINMSMEKIEKIFPMDPNHYQEKWQIAGKNLLYFMNLLDDENKEKVIKWGKENM